MLTATFRQSRPMSIMHTKTHKKPIWPWYSIGFYRLSRYMFMQNFIKLSAAVHELSCYRRKNWATTLKTMLPSLLRAAIAIIHYVDPDTNKQNMNRMHEEQTVNARVKQLTSLHIKYVDRTVDSVAIHYKPTAVSGQMEASVRTRVETRHVQDTSTLTGRQLPECHSAVLGYRDELMSSEQQVNDNLSQQHNMHSICYETCFLIVTLYIFCCFCTTVYLSTD